ncbi:MAG TPA: hypothetical protein VHY35_02755 [Stellaceae bacterium]|jgi:cell division transport system permease protein|nr:hypothetical protein [Stellaceae bacterium]
MIGFNIAIARRPLPLGWDGSAYFLGGIFALLIYIAAASGIGLFVVADTVHAATRSLAASLTVEVPADASDARLQTVLATLRQTPGIVSVHPLDAKEIARLLEPWLGSTAAIGELPAPRLIDLQIDPAGTLDLDALQKHLASVVPEAHLDDHRPPLAEMRAAARRIETVCAMLIAATLAVAGIAAVFAAQAVMNAQHRVVELLHRLGAADNAVAQHFSLRAVYPALLGGVGGGALVLLTTALLRDSGRVVQLPAPLAASIFADLRLWAIVVGAILAGGLIAIASTHITVQRRLARMP